MAQDHTSGLSKVVRFEHKRAYETIADSIRDMIIAGELRPGDQLPSIRELAQSFGVSKVIVGEALRVLSTMGLVETRHGSGTYVIVPAERVVSEAIDLYVTLSAESVYKVYELRKILEPPLVRLAAQRIQPEQLQELDDLLAEMRKCICVDSRLLEADVEFHHKIIGAAGNEIATMITRALHRLTVKSWWGIGGPRDVADKICDTHEEILKALKNRDDVAAAAAMRVHLDASLEDLARMEMKESHQNNE